MANNKSGILKTLLIIIIVLGAVIASFMVFKSKQGDKVIAKVNGSKVYQSELDDRLNKMFRSLDQKIAISDIPPQILESLVQDIYLQRELNKIAAGSKVAKSKEVKKQIEDIKNAIIRQAYLEAEVKEKVTDETVKNKYSEISSELLGKKEMHLRHVLVETEATAKKVAALLKQGNSFAKVAKEYSRDAANAKNGGDLGYIIPDNLDEEFAVAVQKLRKGQISAPIKTKFGWHIVKLENVRNVVIPDFESAKATIADNMRQEVIEGIFSKITKDAKVKILVDSKKEEVVKKETKKEEAPAQNEAKK